MITLSDVSTVIITSVAVGGFIINAFVQWKNGKRSDQIARAQNIVIDATKVAVDKTQATIENVKDNTDGRLTEVIKSHGELTVELKTLREELAKEKQNAAVKEALGPNVQSRSNRTLMSRLEKLTQEIEEIKKEGNS